MIRSQNGTESIDARGPVQSANEQTEKVLEQEHGQGFGVVEFGSATRLTKGSGGRRSETGYAMP